MYKDSHEKATVAFPSCSKNVVEGYTDKTSYFPGEVANVYIQAYQTFQCGLGFYDPSGKLIFSSDVEIFPQTPSVNQPWLGFNYSIYCEVKIPGTVGSGVYFIENKIPIVIKSVAQANVTVVFPINTINAYNASGGKSLYSFNSSDLISSPVISYLRPIENDDEKARCMECFKWFPSLTGINFRYISDQDLDDYSSLSGTKILIIPGHSEYWTRKARTNFDQFVNSGGNAILLSGNSMWWQVRYSDNRDQLICYKSQTLDPDPELPEKTVRWVDPILQYPIINSIGADFDLGGYGLLADKGWNGYKIANGASPLLEGLGLKRGDIVSLPSKECDGAPQSGFDADGFPILDNTSQFAKLELIGFDRGSRNGVETFPMFIALKPGATSGVIVNMGASDWCSTTGIGNRNGQAKKITQNAIQKLLSGSSVFSN
jgi:hypothetical protein